MKAAGRIAKSGYEIRQMQVAAPSGKPNVNDPPEDDARLADGGFALVTVIWGVGLVTLLMLAFTLNVRTQTTLASNAIISAKLEAAADAAVNIAILDLLATAKRLPQARRFPHDGAATTCAMSPDVRITISVQDEEGRVDINTATEPLLRAFISGFGISASESSRHADALMDFRDQDGLRRLHGAEAEEYRAAGLSWGPQNDAFRSIDELYRVLGLPADLVKRMLPFVTVFSGRAGFDPRSAPRQLVRIVESHASVSSDPMLSTFAITSTRRTFSVRAQAYQQGGGAFAREVTVEQAPAAGTFRFRSWRRGVVAEPDPFPGFSTHSPC